MHKATLATALILTAFTTAAQAAPANEREAIKRFAGCFEVTFNFAETFSLKDGYTPVTEPYTARAVEWVTVDEETDNSVMLQHVLLAGDGVQKHWRQTWNYEAPSVREFKGNDTWIRRDLSESERAGRWVQSVSQVDDSPRYACAAPWVIWGENAYWECETWSPLPRREITKRHDYDVLNRRNRQMVTASGWTHEEDNTKLIVQGNTVTPLVKEKGENRYVKVDDARCAAASAYWQTNRRYWKPIQHAWDHISGHHERIQFDPTSGGGRPLWQQLFELADRASRTSMTDAQIEREAHDLIHAFLLD